MIVRNNVWGLLIAVEMTLLAIASFAVVWAYIFWRRGDLKAAAVGGALGVVMPAAALGILVSELLKLAAGVLVLPLLNPMPTCPAGWCGEPPAYLCYYYSRCCSRSR